MRCTIRTVLTNRHGAFARCILKSNVGIGKSSLTVTFRERSVQENKLPPPPPRPARPPARTMKMNATCLSTRPSVRGRDGRGAIGPSHGPTHRRSSHVMQTIMTSSPSSDSMANGVGGEGGGRGGSTTTPSFVDDHFMVRGSSSTAVSALVDRVHRGDVTPAVVSVPPLARRIARAYFCGRGR